MTSGCIGCLSYGRAWNNVPSGVTSFDVALSERSSVDVRPLEEHSEDFSVEAVRNRKSLRTSICRKLMVFVGFLVVLASGIPALVLWLKAYEQLMEEIDRRLLTVSSETDRAGLIANQVLINNYLANQAGNNRSLAEFDLKSAISVISDFLYDVVYDSEGELVISTRDSVFENILQQREVSTI